MTLEMTEPGIGLELIQRKVVEILFEQVNDELDTQEANWVDRDTDWFLLTGIQPESVELEHIENTNFYPGHRPSLVKNFQVANFPNISVMAYQARPNTSIIDQASNFIPTVDIETMVKGQQEHVVDARIHRTVEAIHQVLVRNEKLDGLSFGWENDPIVQITDIFTSKENVSHGEDWLWGAARIRYNLSRHTRLPQNS